MIFPFLIIVMTLSNFDQNRSFIPFQKAFKTKWQVKGKKKKYEIIDRNRCCILEREKYTIICFFGKNEDVFEENN